MVDPISVKSRQAAYLHGREKRNCAKKSELEELTQKMSRLFQYVDCEHNLPRLKKLTKATRSNPKPYSKKEAFEKLTQNLPNKEAELRKGLERQAQIGRLCFLLNQGNWQAIEATYKDSWDFLATDALYALYKEKIEINQFCTVTFRWSLKVDYPGKSIRTIDVFDLDGSLSNEAKIWIENSFLMSKGKKSYLSKEQREEFFKRVKMLPPSERVFFVFENTCNDADNIKNVVHRDGFRVLGRDSVMGIDYEIVASFEMMQEFLNVYAENTTPFLVNVITPREAVKLTPVIGISSSSAIEQNGLDNTRDVCVGFPGVELPRKADNLRAPTGQVLRYHDDYHGFIVTHIPSDSKKAFIRLGQAAKRLSEKEKNPEIRQFLEFLYEQNIDMMFTVYFTEASVENRDPANLMLITLCGEGEEIENSSSSYLPYHSFFRNIFKKMAKTFSTEQSSDSKNPDLDGFVIALKYLPLLIEHDIMGKLIKSLDLGFFILMGISEKVLRFHTTAASKWQESCKKSLQKLTRSKNDQKAYEEWLKGLRAEDKILVTYQGEEMTRAELWMRLLATSYHKIDFATQMAKSLNKLNLTHIKI